MSARTTQQPGRARAGAWPALGLLAMTGCSSDWCPDSWQDRNPPPALLGEHGNCEPPDAVAESVDRQMQTGIYGYVLACEERDDDGDCGCEVTGPYTEGGDVWIGVDKPFPEQDWLYFTVRPDSTYQVELQPGVRYTFENVVVGPQTAVTWDEIPIAELTLEEGEILFVRLTAMISC